MNPKSLFSFLLALLAGPLLAIAADAPAPTDERADMANMRKIGIALLTYQAAKGQPPDYLSDLVPDFLDAKTLVSPLGDATDPDARKGLYDPKLPCSYSYEFGARLYPGSHLTYRALKTLQLQEYGKLVPALRWFPREHTVNLSHAGEFYSTGYQPVSQYRTSWERSVEIQTRLKMQALGPAITDGRKLTVLVSDEDGKPIPGLAVCAVRSMDGMPLPAREFTSDADGKILIALSIAENPAVSFFPTSRDWYFPAQQWAAPENKNPAGEELPSFRFTALSTGIMHGVVRSPTGAPVPKAAVALYLDGGEYPKTMGAAQTDAQGAWSAPGVPKKAANLRLWVRGRGFRAIDAAFGTQGLPEAAAFFSGSADIVLQPPFTVKGVVRSDGHPVAHANVTFDAHIATNGGQATTDVEGRFELAAEIEGDWALITVADGFAPKGESVKIAADAAPLAVTLDAGRPLKGRILRANGTPVAHAPILFRGNQSSDAGTQPVIATTDEDGRFTWPHAPRDVIFCTVLPEGGEPAGFIWHTEKDDPLEVHLQP